MNALEQWHRRPMEVRVLDRCNECGKLEIDVRERVSLWPNITAVSCAKCFAEMTEEGFAEMTEEGSGCAA
ncbi:hypothetical protein [Paraburkholderia xenovorans]|uniref:hypothetical protein n=1 Tax=Paraburkholderia xenovorans TaxID=36873 RepID=UPI0038BB4852